MKSVNPHGVNTGLDTAEREYWQAYARQVADRMGLRDYLVTVSATLDDDDSSGASCQCTYGRRSIRIWLSHYFFSLGPIEQRWTVVHELCHAIMRPVAYLTHKNFENETKERHVLFFTLHKEAEEQAVDHFALVIAESMPLPDALAKPTQVVTISTLADGDMERLVESAERGMQFAAPPNGAPR